MFRYSFICHITCLLHSPSAYTIARCKTQTSYAAKPAEIREKSVIC